MDTSGAGAPAPSTGPRPGARHNLCGSRAARFKALQDRPQRRQDRQRRRGEQKADPERRRPEDRVSPEKGLDAAIRIARAAGMPLRVAAKVDDADRGYFEAALRPMLDGPRVEFLGEIGEAAKAELLGGAAALLFPIRWPEPF